MAFRQNSCGMKQGGCGSQLCAICSSYQSTVLGRVRVLWCRSCVLHECAENDQGLRELLLFVEEKIADLPFRCRSTFGCTFFRGIYS